MKYTMLGLLTGFTVAILLAPAKGRDSRRRMVKPIDNFIDRWTEKGKVLIDQATDKLDNVLPFG